MNSTTVNHGKGKGQYLIVAFLILSSLFFINSYSHFLDFDQKALGKYFPYKWILVGHIVGGATALLSGPLQFIKTFRNRFMRFHRIMGIVYLGAVLTSALCALVLTFRTTAPLGMAYTASLQALIFAWVLTSYTAYATILKRQVLEHQQWMVRSYICTFAFVIQNYLLKIPALMALGPFGEVAATFIWFSFSIPLLVYQNLLTYQRGLASKH
ncbi:MAG TPA: DUF2306 domain-containing protein [Cytophagales bacterium]|nr:DUF2306 domain-containing protein [Cytophagales bacterium]